MGSEKRRYPDHPTVLHDPKKPQWRKMVRVTIAMAVAIFIYFWSMIPSVDVGINNRSPEVQFSWGKIRPSSSLEYHNCFDGFQCARLEVPMDYHRVDGQGRKVAIAIARLPAKVPVTDPRYGGAILINPGGPGGSGVLQALQVGPGLQTIVDAESGPSVDNEETSDRYFDIVGFDPRGVNNTTPGFSCFPDTFSQKNWELQAQAEGMLGSSDQSFMRTWQRYVALNTGCSKNLTTAAGSDALGDHINTTPVARDMLEIVERHAEWRERQGKIKQKHRDRRFGYDQEQAIIRRTEWKRGREKLLYWGRSYGTILGSTFATMFPDHIGRAVLDAVVDAHTYYGIEDGPSGVVDADAAFDQLVGYCDQVGPNGCPLYAAGGPSAIKERFLTVERALFDAPLPVVATHSRGPELVTWTDLKIAQRVAVYQPVWTFLSLAEYASELFLGNGSVMADAKHRSRSPSCPSVECLDAGPWSSPCQAPNENEFYASTAILCADAEHLTRMDQGTMQQYWQTLKEESSAIGDYWAMLGLSCVGWNVTSKWKTSGPFGGHTSHPLLFVSNTLDPVTPLQSAQKMSQRFPGSVVLQQDSEGHSTAAAPSLCTSKRIRHYFQSGELPPPGTVCEPDVRPLIGRINMHDISTGDRALWDALQEIHQIPTGRLPL
ncbi:TAP-like protein-domain-containing protein [Aspergillus avenaceus]|uniref:TAP-like protein-domain-containing protein n=1 Tax=Aspergillus avenaceus TaxID=36643 RepID=A0A5N6U9K5_ASPAV|nr:TAP-like protein-domain-containing protein [Aspergillus avenaceus]